MILKEYKLTNLNELFGYTRLDTNRTGLNVTLMADSTRAYKIYGHMPLIFARNGYDKSIKEYIPFLIAPQSKILDPTIDLNITYSDVFAIEIFIRENFRGLRDLANEKIEDVEFIRSIKPYRIKLERFVINNMENLLKVADGEIDIDAFKKIIVKG